MYNEKNGCNKYGKEQIMNKVWPVNYLVVDNVERYRKIMRYFYKRHRQMQGSMYRPDILKMMQQDYSTDYGELEVDQDLGNLVEWGNLQKQQEMIRPKSIEEYRNKNFRYQITEEGILVEEMVYQLTNQKHAARGALDEKGIRSLFELLQKLVHGKGDVVELWQKIRKEFIKIGEDTANYIGYITSPEVDSRMKTEQFLIYKDKFVNYLREFISSIQGLYLPFTTMIAKLPTVDQERIIDGMFQKEQEIPMMDGVSRTEIAEQVLGEFEALKSWFIGTADRPSEYENLMAQTDQMITKITGLIYYYGQEVHQYQSRKKDYLHLAKWFHQAENLEEAKKMYGGIFGLEHSRHFFVSEGSDATSNRENSWEIEPGLLFLTKRGRGARKERKALSFNLNKEYQKQKVKEYQAEVLQQQQNIESYFTEDMLDFSKIKLLDPQSRKVFLKWISTAIAMHVPDKRAENKKIIQQISTEFAFETEVSIDPSELISVSCEDGILDMPKVIMKRGAK